MNAASPRGSLDPPMRREHRLDIPAHFIARRSLPRERPSDERSVVGHLDAAGERINLDAREVAAPPGASQKRAHGLAARREEGERVLPERVIRDVEPEKREAARDGFGCREGCLSREAVDEDVERRLAALRRERASRLRGAVRDEPQEKRPLRAEPLDDGARRDAGFAFNVRERHAIRADARHGAPGRFKDAGVRRRAGAGHGARSLIPV